MPAARNGCRGSDRRSFFSMIKVAGRLRTIGSMGGASNWFTFDRDGYFWIFDIQRAIGCVGWARTADIKTLLTRRLRTPGCRQLFAGRLVVRPLSERLDFYAIPV